MSRQLAVSSTFSVLMMACHVLFSADAAHVSYAGEAVFGNHAAPVFDAAASLLPTLAALPGR